MREAVWKQLAAEGVSVWLDSTEPVSVAETPLRLPSGDGGVTGQVIGPNHLLRSIDSPARYDALTDLGALAVSPAEAARALYSREVRAACDLLAHTFEFSGGQDGHVSVELPSRPRTAETAVAEARALSWAVDRPNLLVRLPATAAGLDAAARCLGEGIGVDVAPVFSMAGYRRALDALVDGLDRSVAAGGSPARITTAVSFATCQVDAAVDARLVQLPGPVAETLGGRAGQALARLAFRAREQFLEQPRWQALADAGARPHRLAWAGGAPAGTGEAESARLAARYLRSLLAEDTIQVLPASALQALTGDLPLRGDMLSGRFVSAQHDLERLAAAGLVLDRIAEELTARHAARLDQDWTDLVAAVTARL